ncbi:MAG TPA: hypothetical protein VID76_08440 [Solirubrobacterales bacterium]|jgi:hypothetical protein
MRPVLPLVAVLIALSFTACGGNDETTLSTSGASGTSGAQGPANTDMTASEFIAASTTAQLDAVAQAAEDNPDCAKVDTAAGGDFQVNVAIDATTAAPDTPLSQIVADNC